MNTLPEALQDYLALRRSLGYRMHDEGRLLPRFVNFLEERREPHITARSALEWAQVTKVQPAEWARRLRFVRGFARYRSATDPLTEVPPAHPGRRLPRRSGGQARDHGKDAQLAPDGDPLVLPVRGL